MWLLYISCNTSTPCVPEIFHLPKIRQPAADFEASRHTRAIKPMVPIFGAPCADYLNACKKLSHPHAGWKLYSFLGDCLFIFNLRTKEVKQGIVNYGEIAQKSQFFKSSKPYLLERAPEKCRIWEKETSHCYSNRCGGHTWLTLKRPFPSSPGPMYQNEVKCSAFMEMTFHSHANKTHFPKKGCAPSLILKVRVFETRKWPIVNDQCCTVELHYNGHLRDRRKWPLQRGFKQDSMYGFLVRRDEQMWPL